MDNKQQMTGPEAERFLEWLRTKGAVMQRISAEFEAERRAVDDARLANRIAEALGDSWCMDNHEDKAAAVAAVLAAVRGE